MHPRIKSFIHAFNGFKLLMAEEPHARFHLLAAVLVIIAGFYFEISHFEWLAVIICIGVVIAAEAFNTAIENLGDAVSQEKNDHIGKAKDLAASAVLITAMASATIGLIIFLPYIFND